MLFPERRVPFEPVVRVSKGPPRQLAIRDAADFCTRDEPRLFEDAQVLRDARRRDIVRFAERRDGTRAARKPLEHRSTYRIGQGAEYRTERVARVLHSPPLPDRHARRLDDVSVQALGRGQELRRLALRDREIAKRGGHVADEPPPLVVGDSEALMRHFHAATQIRHWATECRAEKIDDQLAIPS